MASSFLPLVGPLPRDQTTVPSRWIDDSQVDPAYKGLGAAERRLEVKEGRTLHLITISCNVFLRGSDVADPELETTKSMLRRAAGVLGRLEDAIIFNGLREGESHPKVPDNGSAVVTPVIYKVSEGTGMTGLLQAPGTLRSARQKTLRAAVRAAEKNVIAAINENNQAKEKTAKAALAQATKKFNDTEEEITDAEKALKDAEAAFVQAQGAGTPNAGLLQARKQAAEVLDQQLAEEMCVPVGADRENSPIVSAIVKAIEKLEGAGQFGPFTAVLGDDLFTEAQTPNQNSLVLPSDRILPFLEGGALLRSGTLPAREGVVVAMAGAPVELVVGTDMDVKFLQTTLEPRYVLRVYERFVLRIKQLDAICVITSGDCLPVLRRSGAS